MNNTFSRALSFLVATLMFPAFVSAQDEQPVQEESVKYRSDAEILAGLEIYAENLNAAYVDMRNERDALRERVVELEAELEAQRQSQDN